MAERLMIFEEAREYLRLNKATLYKFVQTGQIPASKVGRQWRFKEEEIDNWLKEQRISYNKAKKYKETARGTGK